MNNYEKACNKFSKIINEIYKLGTLKPVAGIYEKSDKYKFFLDIITEAQNQIEYMIFNEKD